MPRLCHTVLVALGSNGQTIKLTGKPHGEVADVDHLLDFAETFRLDLADLDGHESAEEALVGPQLFAKEPHEFTALRTRDQAPFEESRMRLLDRRSSMGFGGLPDMRNGFAGDGGFRC